MEQSKTETKQLFKRENQARQRMFLSVFITLTCFSFAGLILLFATNHLRMEWGHHRKNEFPELKVRLGTDKSSILKEYRSGCFVNPPYRKTNLLELPLLNIFYWEPQNQNPHAA